MGHSGSTLLDSILGTHPDFLSTGELQYLGWQLFRTANKKPSTKDEDICTCGYDFRECIFWSRVIKQIFEKTGIDIAVHPEDFKNYFFGQFKYNEKIKLFDRIQGFLTRKILEAGFSFRYINLIEPRINQIINKNWLLFETMSKVSNKNFVVNSSKNFTHGLLFQQSRPSEVWFIFIHRSAEGLASSSKRWKHKTTIKDIIISKNNYEREVNKCKKNISDLNYIDVEYEEFARKPATSLDKMIHKLGALENYTRQSDDHFTIDPSQLHLVAGNPMRYRGKQLVRYDERWKTELSTKEKEMIQRLMQ